MQTVLVTFGTRPEAIKMAPVVAALRERPADFRVVVCVTAQHREMLDQVLDRFGLLPDIDLNLMRPGQRLSELSARVLTAMTESIEESGAERVLVHGDTTTAMATAMAAFHLEVPVSHVEAGLRSGRMDAPFPEEMNRVVIDCLAADLFAPTPSAAANLRAAGVAEERILVTGNTAIDALLQLRERLPNLDLPIQERFSDADPLVLITAHRRESFGAPLRSVFGALQTLAEAHPDVTFVYPVHRNPKVMEPARELLTAPNLALIEPVDYAELVWLLDRARFVISDSGGLQEEAPTLGKPILVLRDVTERPEVIESGAGLLVGTDAGRIQAEAEALLAGQSALDRGGQPRLLFGDGQASQRIAARLAGTEVEPWVPAPAGM